MATPNKTLSNSGALWVIALSLAVIAACLVVLVSRQQNAKSETVATSVPPDAPRQSSRLPQAFNVSPGRREQPADPEIVEVSTATTETVPPPDPAPTEAAAVPQPIVSSGLAPLSYLAATNSPDASNTLSTMRGRVTLDGTPPPENVIKINQMDPQCGQLYKQKTITTRFYAVSKDGGLADVFVFISDGLKGQKLPTPKTPVVLNQKGCFFEPYVFGMMAGQKLIIKNSDKLLHNVHSDPQMRGNEAFNMAEGPGALITKTFRAPEIALRLKCEIHPWMFAYACVVDNPFYAVTDANGNFVISNVPPGDYVLEAYHRKTHGGRVGETQRISVTAGEATTVNFTIKAPPSTGRVAQR